MIIQTFSKKIGITSQAKKAFVVEYQTRFNTSKQAAGSAAISFTQANGNDGVIQIKLEDIPDFIEVLHEVLKQAPAQEE